MTPLTKYYSSSFRLILDVESFLESTGTQVADSVVRANIWESLALASGKTKSDAQLYLTQWGKPSVGYGEHKEFTEMFNFSLTIWRLKSRTNRHVYGELLFGTGREPNPLNISVGNEWNEESEEISADDKTSWIKDPEILNFMACPFDGDCDFVTDKEQKMKAHIAAHNRDRIHCDEAVVGDNVFLLDEMISARLLPRGFRTKYFVCWDVESLLVPSDIGRTHCPFSIAATKNFGSNQQWFSARTDSSRLHCMKW